MLLTSPRSLESPVIFCTIRSVGRVQIMVLCVCQAGMPQLDPGM